MPDSPISIFISYAHTDSALVDRLEADLRTEDYEPWVDRQRLHGGQRWRRELQEAVKSAQVLLIVLSPDAVASPNVQVEYDYVLELGKVVIPLYYRQCDVPMELRAIQWIDFRQSYEQGFQALLHVLHPQQSNPSPAASSVESRPQHPKHPVFNNLPSQLTPVIGREQEIESACTLVRQPEVRLVTLTGTGGIGKTRLGLQIATKLLEDFADGVCFVSLASLTDPALVIPTTALTLSLREVGDQSALEQLKAYLREKQVLLLLDNFEQVLSAGPGLTELLLACRQLKILVTSRAVLHLQGEYEFAVPPLALPEWSHLPPSDQLAQYAAVALLLQRVKAIKPDFHLTAANARTIAEICLRLEGLPLAIELAAARLKVLPPQTLLARLSQGLQVLTGGASDLPARQQTLQRTIQWSYDLLGPGEQTLFRLLSIFVGGWTLEAAEALAQGTGKANLDVLNTLSALFDNSLIQQSEQEGEEPRFLMLQSVREYGLGLLDASGERETTQAAHAHFFLALAEQAEPALQGPEQAAWLKRLEHELDNLHAALEWALVTDEQATKRRELALRLSAALETFWWMHGPFREGRAFLERALAQSEGESASLRANALRANALRAAANLAEGQGDHTRADMLVQQSLALYRELGDTRGIANCLFLVQGAAWRRGQLAEVITLLEERVKLMRQVGEPWEVAEPLFYLADTVVKHGEHARGQALFEEALLLFRKAGNALGVGRTLVQSAFWLWWSGSGEATTIRQRLQEGQARITEAGDRFWIAHSSSFAAWVALSEGKVSGASRLAQESLALFREMDARFDIALALYTVGRVEAQQNDLRGARSHYQESLAISRELGEQFTLSLSLEGLAGVLAKQRELRWAAQLWGAAESLREAIAVPLPPVDRARYEQAVASARTQLGEPAFTAAWHEGRTMTLEQVFDDALRRGDEADKQ